MTPGLCINCRKPTLLIDSHVISESIRNRFFGNDDTRKGPYRFTIKSVSVDKDSRTSIEKYSSGAQTLPTHPLMCKPCDESYGSGIESVVAKKIQACKIAKDPHLIYDPDVLEPSRFQENLGPLGVKPYFEYQELDADVLNFCRLTCWRALHAMILAGNFGPATFLKSRLGAAAEANLKNRLAGSTFSQNDDIILLVPHFCILSDTLGGNLEWSGFGWYWVESTTSQKAVVVWCSHWVAIWQPAFSLQTLCDGSYDDFMCESLKSSREKLRDSVQASIQK